MPTKQVNADKREMAGYVHYAIKSLVRSDDLIARGITRQKIQDMLEVHGYEMTVYDLIEKLGLKVCKRMC